MRYDVNVSVLRSAIKHFGERAQEEIAIEECSELIQAISHKHRGRKHNIAEEIADVEICLDQLKIINDCSNEVLEIKAKKLRRLGMKIGVIDRIWNSLRGCYEYLDKSITVNLSDATFIFKDYGETKTYGYKFDYDGNTYGTYCLSTDDLSLETMNTALGMFVQHKRELIAEIKNKNLETGSE